MPSRFSTDYRNLRPYVLEDVRAIVSAGASSGSNAAALTAHRLNDTTYHIGQLDPSQATWALTTTAGDARYALATRQIIAGNGLTGGGALSGDVTLDVGAGDGISVAANAVALASTVAGNGLTYTTGVIAVGVANTGATGLTVEADAVRLTSSSNPGAAASVLASDAAGALTLTTLTASTKVRSPLLDTASGNLTLQPAGDITIDPVGNDVLPATNYDINLGALSKKYLTLHAAELWVETLVAQNTIATIGGRILVGPTTTLTRDLAAAATTIYVKHNQMVSGDRAYMEADGKVEFFAITSGATNTGTDYSYTVTRNLDGTGANDWYAGDAMFNTGQAGNGWIDQYSVRGIKSASQVGPTIVGNVRASATYNDWAERWAIGNLNGLYGYGTDIYGFAAGVPGGTWVTVEGTNGLMMMRGSVARLQIDTSGNLQIRDSSGTNVIALDNSGASYFAGVMTIGTSGEIRQGTGTLGSNYTGLRIWRDSNIGRIGGYNNNTLQWYAGTDGYLYAGGGAAAITRYGYMIQDMPDSPSFTWPFLWGGLHAVNDITTPGSGWKSSLMFGEPTLVYSGSQRFRGWLFQFAGDLASPPVSGEVSEADYCLTIQDANTHVWKVWHQGNDSIIAKWDYTNNWAATQTFNAGLALGNAKIYCASGVQVRNAADTAYQNFGANSLMSSSGYVTSDSTITFTNVAGSAYQSLRAAEISVNGYVRSDTVVTLTNVAGSAYQNLLAKDIKTTTFVGLPAISAPATDAGSYLLYIDTADGKLKYKTTGGTVRTISYT